MRMGEIFKEFSKIYLETPSTVAYKLKAKLSSIERNGFWVTSAFGLQLTD